MREKNDEHEGKYVLTPWGCLAGTLNDYGIDVSFVAPRIGEHLVEDFFDSMIKAGHVKKMQEGDK